jgi:autoinducer 2-degrading protein
MIALLVSIHIKPDKREQFLAAIEDDAICSERDEPGCLRFNVLEDQADPNHFFFYEVYKDEAAVEAHRAAPHYARWLAAREETVERADRFVTTPRFPRDEAYWAK